MTTNRLLLKLLFVVTMATALMLSVGVGSAQTTDCYDQVTEDEGACPDPVVSPDDEVQASGGDLAGNSGLIAVEYQNGKVESRNVGKGNEVSAAAKARNEKGVKLAEVDNPAAPVVLPNDPLLPPYQTNLRNNPPGYPAGWDVANGGSKSNGEVTAVLDSGVDQNHPDVTPNVTLQRDFVDNDDVAEPADYHGTAVTSIANAVTNNGVGMAGAMWGGNSMHGKVCRPDPITGQVLCPQALIAAGLNWVVDQKAAGVPVKQVNLSIAGPGSSTILENAVARTNQANILVVAAAGNAHVDLAQTPYYPACIPGVLGVGSASKDGSTASTFTNYDSRTTTGDKCVDVYAPGDQILSAMLSDGSGCTMMDGGPYCFASGTSMAAPHVAATSAQVRDKTPSLTRAQVFSRIVNEAKVRQYANPGPERFLSDKCALKPGVKGC